MSLYELESMMRSFQKLSKGKANPPPPSDDDFADMLDRVRDMNLPDVVV